MRTKRFLNLVTCCLVLVGTAMGQSASSGGTIAIRNARLVTVSGATIERGTLVIQDGKIAALGATVSIPRGARVIDGTGLSVYPGMINALTILGLTEVGAVSATVDTTELGDFNANAKALTAVNPHSELIPVARMNGVTTTVTCPLGGLIAGQCAVIHLDGWTPEEMKVVSPAAMHINYPRLGFGGRGGFGGGGFSAPNEQQRQARDRQVESLRTKIEDAQAYRQARVAAAADRSLPARAVDLGLEAMIPVLEGKVPIIVSADSESEIKGALDLAEKFKLKLIINGGEQAIRIAKDLKEKQVPVVLPSVLSLPDSDDSPYDEPFARAAALHAAGVKICFSTGGASDARLLPYHAGMAAAFGLPKEEALKATTLYPAQIFGVDQQLGSLEVGKLATIVVTDGDLLEFRTRVKLMFIHGRPTDLANKHSRLYDKFKERQ